MPALASHCDIRTAVAVEVDYTQRVRTQRARRRARYIGTLEVAQVPSDKPASAQDDNLVFGGLVVVGKHDQDVRKAVGIAVGNRYRLRERAICRRTKRDNVWATVSVIVRIETRIPFTLERMFRPLAGIT
ncbi:hypothetical protein ACFL59_10860, partial [Planctomycetota bacterium]